MKTIYLKDIEKEYKNYVQTFLNNGNQITAQTLITLSKSLFKEIKVRGIQANDDDALLFQYGIYDWEKVNNPYFKLDVTRQLCKKNGEMYQLSFCLLFSADEFSTIESYNKWSFGLSLNEWGNQVIESEGYQKTLKKSALQHNIKLDLI